MKLKVSQAIPNLLNHGINLERISDSVISVTSNNEIPVNILLPLDFDLEKEAVKQLINFAHFSTPSGSKPFCACATPDFHTGSSVPVGSVVVTPHSMVIPHAIGTDINCGMRLHSTGLNISEFLLIKFSLLQLLKGDLLEGTRDLPTSKSAMSALFSEGWGSFLSETKKDPRGLFSKVDFSELSAELGLLHVSSLEQGNSAYAPEALQARDWMRDPSLGTLGGGNHFLEFQVVSEVVDRKIAFEQGLKVGDVVFMVHTGSRDVGFHIGQRWMDKAKANYPKGLKHPQSGIYAIEDEQVPEYLAAMHSAAHYATANRALLAELVRNRIRQVTSRSYAGNLIADVPHNIILKESIGNVHRKGATPAYHNQLLVIPGSMGHSSYLLNGKGCEAWMQSASHGAGRNYSRRAVTAKGKLDFNSLGLTGIECITLKEERKIEEAPSAYKDIGPVIQSQVDENVIDVVVKLDPLVTFKA